MSAGRAQRAKSTDARRGWRPYTPRLRPDQVEALHHLKQRLARPMTELAQEAVDRFLADLGSAATVIREGRAADP